MALAQSEVPARPVGEPDEALDTFPKLLLDHARRHGARPAILDGSGNRFVERAQRRRWRKLVEKLGGILVTGWTYRRFALHLQETLRHDLAGEQLEAGDTGKLPIVYVAVFDKTGVYGAPQTPAVNESALANMGLVDKTANGIVSGVVNVTDRDFGWAATRTPKLGPDLGIAVLRSEI